MLGFLSRKESKFDSPIDQPCRKKKSVYNGFQIRFMLDRRITLI